jgi:gamma-glutamylcyclotransferase (GGCT)/AIG2-like uncharacterized protein YtfP
MKRLFVYGTLREGGSANNFLEGALFVKKNVIIKRYALYDTGFYPYAVFTGDQKDLITGDIFLVKKELFSLLNWYEGNSYRLIFDEQNNFYIYIWNDAILDEKRKIKDGDWIKYYLAKGQNLKQS